MKRFKNIILVCMAILSFHTLLTAAEEVKYRKTSLSPEVAVLLNQDSGLVCAGVNIQTRLTPQLGFGMDVLLGIDPDGEAYTVLLPNVSYHFLAPTKRWDLFAGLGVSMMVNKPSFSNSNIGSNVYLMGGSKVKISELFGVGFRVFIGPRVIGGGSVGLTFSF